MRIYKPARAVDLCSPQRRVLAKTRDILRGSAGTFEIVLEGLQNNLEGLLTDADGPILGVPAGVPRSSENAFPWNHTRGLCLQGYLAH